MNKNKIVNENRKLEWSLREKRTPIEPKMLPKKINKNNKKIKSERKNKRIQWHI